MSLWCCIEPERIEKTQRIMQALAAGWPGGRVCNGSPPNDGNPFVVWGQKWTALQIIPPALKIGRPFFQIDNGFTDPARGELLGNYRFMYRSPAPVFISDADLRDSRGVELKMKPWRTRGTHILLAMPGREKGGFGSAFCIDMDAWCRTILPRISKHTNRPIRLRDRSSIYPLQDDLRDCWAVVTHSSNVGFDAVVAGIPVFVEPTSMAAPVGNLDLKDIETPLMPDRLDWWKSLSCQQFSISEMRDGTAFRYLSAVARQVDAAAVAA